MEPQNPWFVWLFLCNMKKQKDPAFLFYSKDWLTGTSFFTFEQKGKYIELLCNQHTHGHLSEKMIKIICQGEIDDEVMAKFECDKDGNWYNAKLDLEIQRRKEYSILQKERVMKRYTKKDTTVGTELDTDLPTSRTETETETETEATISKLSKTHVRESQTQTLTDPLEDLYSDLI